MIFSPALPRRANNCGQGFSLSASTLEFGKRLKSPGIVVVPWSSGPADFLNPSHNRCLGRRPTCTSLEKRRHTTKSTIYMIISGFPYK